MDLPPVIALALLAGLRGPRFGRSVLFALPVPWLVGSTAGVWLAPQLTLPGLEIILTIGLGALLAADRPLPFAFVVSQAYAEYGITEYETGDYEVDHLIPLSLGGSNSIRNLWPQSTNTSPWNSYVKDALERKLHNLVCAGQLDLKTAQREIASDWIEGYKKYIRTRPPLQQSTRQRLHRQLRPMRSG